MARKPYKEKVIYDPYNLSAVVEKFKAEDKAERKKQRIAKSVATRKQNRIKKQKDDLKKNQQQLKKVSEKLEKTTVTGPLGGKIKVKTLKKITGGAPGLNKGPRSKMYIGKKFNQGGSNMADYEKEKKKIKKKTEKLSIMGAGPSPLRMIGRAFENRRRKKQRQKELAALPMKVDDFKKDHQSNVIKQEVEDFAKRVRSEVGIPEPKRKGMKFDRVRKNMGGVMRNRGGTFKGVY